MLSFRNLSSALQKFDLDGKPVIVHASLSAFGQVRGGAETVLGALLTETPMLMMPTFTYQTMVVPTAGPPDNGITYGTRQDSNRMAQFFTPEMPADKSMGVIAETLRQRPEAKRSMHPIYSFAGIGVKNALDAQTLDDPLAPIAALTEANGWVLLMGVDHTVNTSIHYGEQLAGRRQFIRWALTYQGVVECPHWPGCSGGFNEIAPHLEWITQTTQIGNALVQAIPLQPMIEIVQDILHENPLALLCDQPECERCNAVRDSVQNEF